MVIYRAVIPLLLALCGAASPLIAQVGTTASEQGTWLRPGDVLRVSIWREADLSGEFQVDASGTVTLPMLGRRNVTDEPIEALIDDLTAEYQKQLRNPSITFTPLKQVFLLGDVARPGLYTVPPTTTLAGAVALAGGPSTIGDLNKIRVLRGGEVVHERVPMEDAIHLVDIRSGDQIYVGRTPWVSRNVPYLVGVGLTMVSIGLQLLR